MFLLPPPGSKGSGRAPTPRHPPLWLEPRTRLLKCQRVFPALGHLWQRAHLSRLCFFALFFFLSLWEGEELPNLLMETKKKVWKVHLWNVLSSVLAVLHFVPTTKAANLLTIFPPLKTAARFTSQTGASLSLSFWPCQKTVQGHLFGPRLSYIRAASDKT